jgi:DNA-binding NarL/FixJ family response regulator
MAIIKLLLADDHALVRNGLRQLFGLTQDITVAAEAMNGEQVLNAIRPGRFDLVLLDMNMPKPSGAPLIEKMRTQVPNLPILVLSMHNEAQIAASAIAAGAAGYLTKDCDPEILINTIRSIASGEPLNAPVLGAG